MLRLSVRLKEKLLFNNMNIKIATALVQANEKITRAIRAKFAIDILLSGEA